MIIVRLTGGLGNQMFQYAFGRSLAEKHQTELKLDLRFYSDPLLNVPVRTYDLDIFNICENIATETEIARFAKRVRHELTDRALNRVLGLKRSHIREPHYHFSPTAFDSPDNVYISGYWQSEKYFSELEALIRSEFTFRDEPSPNASKLIAKIIETNGVCVHVRRGDFLVNPFNGLHGVEYYGKGEEILLSRYKDLHFFVFSDDIDWCEENLRFDSPTTFVSHDFGPRKFRDDLRLMSACTHFIIANSSFSWWAAWLGGDRDKAVIAPSAWVTDSSYDTGDLIPSGWLII